MTSGTGMEAVFLFVGAVGVTGLLAHLGALALRRFDLVDAHDTSFGSLLLSLGVLTALLTALVLETPSGPGLGDQVEWFLVSLALYLLVATGLIGVPVSIGALVAYWRNGSTRSEAVEHATTGWSFAAVVLSLLAAGNQLVTVPDALVLAGALVAVGLLVLLPPVVGAAGGVSLSRA